MAAKEQQRSLAQRLERLFVGGDVAPGQQYQIAVIKKLDDDMMNGCVTAVGFADYVNGVPPKRSRTILLGVAMFLVALMPIRFCYLSFIYTDSATLKTLGDPFGYFGDRIMLNLCMCACYLYIGIEVFLFQCFSLTRKNNYWIGDFLKMMSGSNDSMHFMIKKRNFRSFRLTVTAIYCFMRFLYWNCLFFFGAVALGPAICGCMQESG